MKAFRQLIINPGSTSTKIAVFDNEQLLFEQTLRHSSDELRGFEKITDQYEFREQMIERALAEHNVPISSLDGVVGRGGLLKPVEGGTYKINNAMIADLKVGVQGEHASNLGGLIASAVAGKTGIPAFITDPVVVDELEPVARFSGHPLFDRKSIFHALNQKAVARRASRDLGRAYEETNLIVAHLGGGVSVGAHRRGRVIDVNNALDGEGPFSPERSGGLPIGAVVKACFSGAYTKEQMGRMIKGEGGMAAYLKTNDAREVENRALAGEQAAVDILLAMAYQVSKSIGECAAVLCGEVDAVLITGGLARCPLVTDEITRRVSFIADVLLYPGEDELLALAQGGLRVLSGLETAKEYG